MACECLPHTSTKPFMSLRLNNRVFLHNSSHSVLAVTENNRFITDNYVVHTLLL